mmetsp:Transcript_4563/g.8962  ORF Transcript_4563/g.8962 Transcript_4563/m.8962 type:complete len:537 (-) Transcript_4563:42-1652(-)
MGSKEVVLIVSVSAAVGAALSSLYFLCVRPRVGKETVKAAEHGGGKDSNGTWNWRKKPSHRRSSLVLLDAAQRLEAKEMIDLHLSPTENALTLIKDLMICTAANPEYLDKLMFIAATIGMDTKAAHTPHMLQESFKLHPRNIIDDAARRHIVHCYAGMGAHEEEPRKKTFKQVAGAVKFMVRLMHSVEGRPVDVLPYPTENEAEERCITAVLDRMSEWDFDVFELHRVTKGRPLQTLGWRLLQQYSLVQRFGICPETLKRFLEYIESHYQDNPYHNAIHATDVLQCVHYMIHKGDVGKHLADADILALLVAAMMHDVDHDGVSNDFHKQSLTNKALRHNNRSVLENHHLSSVFTEMTRNPSIDVLGTLNKEVAKSMRETLINLVLGTDMTHHFVNLKEFSALAVENEPQDWVMKEGHKERLMWMVLHTSDISAQARPSPLFKKWSDRCYAEFFRQGDQERALGRNISPLMERETTRIAQSQVGFIKFIVLPTFEAMALVSPEVGQVPVPTLKQNLVEWESLAAADMKVSVESGNPR